MRLRSAACGLWSGQLEQLRSVEGSHFVAGSCPDDDLFMDGIENDTRLRCSGAQRCSDVQARTDVRLTNIVQAPRQDAVASGMHHKSVIDFELVAGGTREHGAGFGIPAGGTIENQHASPASSFFRDK